MRPVDVVRAAMTAYRRQDLSAAERLLAPDFVFISPQDDHLDRETYLRRCFPTADRFVTQEIVHLVPAGEEGALLLYEYELRDGTRYRNAEFSTVRDGRLVRTEVYFGGRL